MKALIQRVSSASVSSEGILRGSIGRGLLVLAGFGRSDTERDLEWMTGKVLGLRVFPDDDSNMNLSVTEVGGGILVVSQFTLHADTRKGRRPSFMAAADPSEAETLYDLFVSMLAGSGLEVSSGVFGSMMKVSLVNEGPVTLMIDSPSERE
ncbi:MAG: D-tyrosyl-tRNA(Tyr) deacylase [Candidatus Aegiribacteria sp. MLS_C]|nr:MAG: D-tyrosyl-tRNA(Tyr) deacylase [Candidatus Aegiribacteria sp. MLS_C]